MRLRFLGEVGGGLGEWEELSSGSLEPQTWMETQNSSALTTSRLRRSSPPSALPPTLVFPCLADPSISFQPNSAFIPDLGSGKLDLEPFPLLLLPPCTTSPKSPNLLAQVHFYLTGLPEG